MESNATNWNAKQSDNNWMRDRLRREPQRKHIRNDNFRSHTFAIRLWGTQGNMSKINKFAHTGANTSHTHTHRHPFEKQRVEEYRRKVKRRKKKKKNMKWRTTNENKNQMTINICIWFQKRTHFDFCEICWSKKNETKKNERNSIKENYFVTSSRSRADEDRNI